MSNRQLLWIRGGRLDGGRCVFFFFRRPNHRPHRNLHDFVRAGATAHFLSHPVPAVLRLNQRLVEKICEVIDVPVRSQNHVTTTPSIAAVWPAFRHKFFSPKTDAPAPPFSRLRKNFYPIDEHDGFKLPSARTRVIPERSRGMPLHYFTEFCGILRLSFASFRMTATTRKGSLSSLRLHSN